MNERRTELEDLNEFELMQVAVELRLFFHKLGRERIIEAILEAEEKENPANETPENVR